MAEYTNIPSSAACGQWETLLAEALDYGLDNLSNPSDADFFAAHMAVCPACTALFEDARRGREWLEFLSPEPEVPAGLLDKILAQTGPGQVEGYGLIPADNILPIPGSNPAWQRPGLMGLVAFQARRFAEPRLIMTAAMAFFTIALTLNLTGVRLTDLRLASLRPAALRSVMERRLTMASTPIIRYYDHLNFVYQVQSAMRQLRLTTEGEDNEQRKRKDTAPGESRQSPVRKDGDFRMDPAQEAENPARDDSSNSSDFLETSQTFTSPALQDRPAHSGGSATAVRDRSTKWTA